MMARCMGFGFQYSVVSEAGGVKRFEDFLTGLLHMDIKGLKHTGGDTLAVAQEAEQNMFRADICVIKSLGLLGSESQSFLNPRGVGDISNYFLPGPNSRLFLHF